MLSASRNHFVAENLSQKNRKLFVGTKVLPHLIKIYFNLLSVSGQQADQMQTQQTLPQGQMSDRQ